MKCGHRGWGGGGADGLKSFFYTTVAYYFLTKLRSMSL